MNSDLLISVVGIIIFSMLMYLGLKYSNGKWNVSADKKEVYDKWVIKNGQKLKRSIIIVSIIYGIFMFLQIYNLTS